MSPLTIPTVWPLSANARATDPLSSHVAMDKAATSRTAVVDAVLWLINRYGPLTGQELNVHYRNRQRAAGWPKAAYESPRKRAAELVGDRLVIVNPEAIKKRGTPAVYALPEVSS